MSLPTTLQNTALFFLNRHKGEHFLRDRKMLVDRCIAHLVEHRGVSSLTAKDVTMQALGELDVLNRRAYIDCSRTTSFTLFLVDQASGDRHAFTISDLLAMIDTQHPLRPAAIL